MTTISKELFDPVVMLADVDNGFKVPRFL